MVAILVAFTRIPCCVTSMTVNILCICHDRNGYEDHGEERLFHIISPLRAVLARIRSDPSSSFARLLSMILQVDPALFDKPPG
jgi:hypothetical protein